MEPFYFSHEEFWEWFDRNPALDDQVMAKLNSMMGNNMQVSGRRPMGVSSQGNPKPTSLQANYEEQSPHNDGPGFKRMKTGCSNRRPVRHIVETEASVRCDSRYVIMYGKHRPGKKAKVWEGDGYLSFVNGVAHLSDLKGKILEEPIILDDVDMGLVQDLGELMIGNTEVAVVEQDK